MKSHNSAAVFLIFLELTLNTTAVFANEASTEVQSSTDSIQTIEISSKRYNFNYKEVDQRKNFLDSEEGWLTGKRFSYKNQNQDTKTYWRILLENTKQNTHYNGFLQYRDGHTTPYQGITNDKLTTTEITFANPVDGEKDQYVYTGYGFRAWNRNLTGHGGYLEKYSWGYIPVGYRQEYQINEKWDGAVDIAVRFMFKGQMKTYYNGGTTDVGDKFTLGNKVGFKAEVPFNYKINPQLSAVITPWYEYSAIGISNVVNGYVEPDSTTHQYGIDLGLSYKF